VFFIVLLFPAISTGWRLPHFNPLIDAAKLRKIFHSCKYLKKKNAKIYDVFWAARDCTAAPQYYPLHRHRRRSRSPPI
jgi:hypothetical protein